MAGGTTPTGGSGGTGDYYEGGEEDKDEDVEYGNENQPPVENAPVDTGDIEKGAVGKDGVKYNPKR